MIRRHPPTCVGMSAFYTDCETGAPLFNDRLEVADENDVYFALSSADMQPDVDRLILEICADQRRKGEKLTPLWLRAELDAFQRTRIEEPV